MMRAADTALLVVDVQERLLAVQPQGARIEWNCRRLLDGAKTLGVKAVITEQYPEKLGPTPKVLLSCTDEPALEKIAFSCGERGEVFAAWLEAGIHRVLLAGIETHVCVQQTALDLLAAGFQVLVAVDAVGSRYKVDHGVALRRMEASGVLLTTTEAALFEWCERAGTPQFKAISALAKQTPPAGSEMV
ncbi:putative hydrolase [Adhaeretor mobilis]|uniref:Putative hydrolase n=2 Tax=Adhaeretor mobilis TaxID=1930276 RepID=A0A517MUR8_9BACT|nr:putative hydrolase [Adhaeretor mobilis]